MKKKILIFVLLIAYPLTLIALSGCIHAGAGVWKKGVNDETPTVHQVGF